MTKYDITEYETTAINVFQMQCNFYNDKHEAFKTLSSDYKKIILSRFPELTKNKSKKTKARYYSRCWNITEENSKYLPGIKKRKFKEYDIDHIVPISYGYKHNIPPHLIGSIENIQLIEHSENTYKSTKITSDAIAIIKTWKSEGKI